MRVPPTRAENNSEQLDRMEYEVFRGSMYAGLERAAEMWHHAPSPQEKHL